MYGLRELVVSQRSIGPGRLRTSWRYFSRAWLVKLGGGTIEGALEDNMSESARRGDGIAKWGRGYQAVGFKIYHRFLPRTAQSDFWLKFHHPNSWFCFCCRINLSIIDVDGFVRVTGFSLYPEPLGLRCICNMDGSQSRWSYKCCRIHLYLQVLTNFVYHLSTMTAINFSHSSISRRQGNTLNHLYPQHIVESIYPLSGKNIGLHRSDIVNQQPMEHI